jgi:hypothetical protein
VTGCEFRVIDAPGVDAPTASIGVVAANTVDIYEDLKVGQTIYANTGINVGVQGIHSSGPISLETTVQGSGGNAIAGLYGSYTMNNSTASGFQFGNRFLSTISSSTAGTHVGEFIRMTDNTSLSSGQVVRGMEIQAYSGSNNNGINTGITSYGKTFGLHGVTTAQASAVAQAAAVFADLDNGTDSTTKTLGNAIRAYTNDATSADLVSLYQETSAYTGAGIVMNFGNNSGSYTGNFIDLQIAGASKYSINFNNSTDIITQTFGRTASVVDYASATNGNTFIWKIPQKATTGTCASAAAEGVIFQNTGGTQVGHICIDGPTSGTANKLRFYAEQFNGTSTDVAENYSDIENTLEAGDVVAWDPTHLKAITKATASYSQNLAGIISTSPGVLLSGISESNGATDLINPKPLALSGRVPVKVSGENGPIVVGDYLTASPTKPGYAMKATKPGMIIAQALQAFNVGEGKIESFVNLFYYDPSLSLDESGNIMMQYGESSVTVSAQTTDTAAYIIKQKGTGNILQLQDNDTNRLIVASSGSTTLNTQVSEGTVLEVKNNDTSLFTIRATGTAVVNATLVVKKDIAALGRILGSTAIVGKNTSNEPIHQGDVVMLTGATEVPALGEQPTVTVAKAVNGQGVLVGIADKNLQSFAIDENVPQNNDETVIAPGEFMSIVITGTYKKVFVSGSVSVGDKLTSSSEPGKAGRLDQNTPGQVVGISLDNAPASDGSIRVMLLGSFQSQQQIIQQMAPPSGGNNSGGSGDGGEQTPPDSGTGESGESGEGQTPPPPAPEE